MMNVIQVYRQLEGGLNVERTKEGLESACARGRKVGRLINY
jgi:DNA invertase Pin-like site-specific DNA recombinase